MLRMASRTRSRTFGLTAAVWLMTCETVPIETFARSAICRMVTGVFIGSHAAPRPITRVYFRHKLAGLTMLTNIKGFKGYVHFDPGLRRVGGCDGYHRYIKTEANPV